MAIVDSCPVHRGSYALDARRAGQPEALNRLFSVVYPELHQLAHRQLLRATPGSTLNTTALVHEVYLKLARAAEMRARDRSHFFAVAACAMRQIIVDAARRARALKRTPSSEIAALAGPDPESQAENLIALDRALDDLATVDARLVRMVELRFFAGLSVEETAETLELSCRTVKRDWRKARAFLYRVLSVGRAA